MLISFRVENFRSLRDEAELSMVVPSWAETDHATVEMPGAAELRVGTVAGIFGSNASGKTTVLRAMWQMSAMVLSSHQKWKPNARVPYSPFFVEPYDGQPTMFDADILVEGERYQYGFRFDHQKILEEWLYSFPKNRPRLIFERDESREVVFRFGRALRGRPTVIADLTRPNSLFLSAAAANNHQQLTPVAEWFDNHFVRATFDDRQIRIRATLALAKEDPSKRKVLDLLRSADLGIEDVRFVDHEVDEETRVRVTNVMRAINPEQTFEEVDWNEISQETQFQHRVEGNRVSYLSINDESDGTRAWLGLIGPMLSALESGQTLVVDELDASLHPKLTSEVVRFFHDPQLNRNGAQLIFNTHDPSLMGALLGDSPLRRDEVWLTEKGSDSATRLYPLTDFKPRKAENLERGYLQGRYGGVPFVDRDLAIAAIKHNYGGDRASA
ncbi:ATP/GTP-binding protein [Paractinoplanes rhizophilus]|uniref:ATP/GTP-binding protein n=1 Tax=Paractinoplanes rhizophilus TaxID=1416877 RepID=A0ABW2HU92_9ACTN|nr:ATP-binding protein [Actinoplanes sp.]